MEAARKFTIGQQLSARSMCDYDCVFQFTVVKRTAKFVTLQYFNELKRVGIKTNNEGSEYCLPFGSYSMSAIVYA